MNKPNISCSQTMACSKLFSGDLPEISTFIIQVLRNDVNTLYSLALVNRFWCRLAIPLLWEDPFSIKYRKSSFHFLDIYLLFLNDNDKDELKEILKLRKFDSISRKPLFNYPSFIKTLDLKRMQIHVTNWISSTSTSLFSRISNYSPLTLINRMYTQCELSVESEYETTLFIGLLKLFIENNATLNNLYIISDTFSHPLFCTIISIILNNSKFISEIEILSFDIDSDWPQLIQQLNTLLSPLLSLPSLFTSVKHIDISTYEFEIFFANIIKSQSQLYSFKTILSGDYLLD